MPNTKTDTKLSNFIVLQDSLPLEGVAKEFVASFSAHSKKISVYPNKRLAKQKVPANVRINIRREDLIDILSKDPEDTFGSDIVELTLLDADAQADSPCQEENFDSPLDRIARMVETLCQGENCADPLEPSDPFATPLDTDDTPDDTPASPLQQQIGGEHYKNCPIQPVEYCQHNGLNYCESNVVKYVTRHRDKGGVEDLKKAKHYIDLLIAMEYGVDC
jgi:hypothetical protein